MENTQRIIVVSDIDGCLTDGGLYYTAEGKVMKRFGAGDHEGLKLLKKNNIDTVFITADKVGLPIVQARMKDMSNSTLLVFNEEERFDYIDNLRDEYDIVIFFGDGLGDLSVYERGGCDYFVCPKNARAEIKDNCDHVAVCEGGHGAFLDIAIWACNKFRKETYEPLYERRYE